MLSLGHENPSVNLHRRNAVTSPISFNWSSYFAGLVHSACFKTDYLSSIIKLSFENPLTGCDSINYLVVAVSSNNVSFRIQGFNFSSIVYLYWFARLDDKTSFTEWGSFKSVSGQLKFTPGSSLSIGWQLHWKKVKWYYILASLDQCSFLARKMSHRWVAIKALQKNCFEYIILL